MLEPAQERSYTDAILDLASRPRSDAGSSAAPSSVDKIHFWIHNPRAASCKLPERVVGLSNDAPVSGSFGGEALSQHTVTTASADTSPAPQLFTRQATGLVRAVPQWSAAILNFLPTCPAQVLTAGFFFGFALFPGANFLLALLLVLPMTIAFAYSFGLLTSALPRAGGDYLFVSRIIHPLGGLISSFFMTTANMLSNAFFAVAFATIAVGPGFQIIGLISGSSTLMSWGTSVSTSKGWEFAVGAICILIAALLLLLRWRWSIRLQTAMFGMVIFGLVVCGAVALFTSHGAFITNFNSFARPFTHRPDTYHNVITTAQKAGVETSAPFSFAHTLPLVAILAGWAVYNWFGAFLGGELRQANTVRTANRMALAGVVGIASIALFALIFLHTFGQSFMTAANDGGMPPQIGAPPFYFFLISASVDNTVLAVILVATFVVFWPLITYMASLQPTRMIFAYAFDGILPKKVTAVSDTGSPYAAVILTTVGSLGILYWGIHASTFFQILVYATLFQLIAMCAVGLAAVLLPYRQKALFNASATTRRILHIPVVSIAGVSAIISGVLLYVLYFHYANLGLANRTKFFTFFGIVLAAAILFYVGARAVRRRQGVDLGLVYSEIPPE